MNNNNFSGGGNGHDRRKKKRATPTTVATPYAPKQVTATLSKPPLTLSDALSILALAIGAIGYLLDKNPKNPLVVLLWLVVMLGVSGHLGRKFIKLPLLRAAAFFTLGAGFCWLAWYGWSTTKEVTLNDLPENYRDALHCDFSVRRDEYYPEGTEIAGLIWKNGSILTNVKLFSPPNIKLKNLELKLAFDAQFMGGAQVTKAPSVFLAPISRENISGWQGGNIVNGKDVPVASATPDDLQNVNNYPANESVYKEGEMYSDVPITLAFVAGTGYTRGNFTYAMSPSVPHGVQVTGSYDVEYRGKVFTLPVRKFAR